MAHLSNEKNLIVKYLLFLGNDATQFFWGFVKKTLIGSRHEQKK